MKFIKKAAALFFCAALALSVMAISAMADDEAELLQPDDPTFTAYLAYKDASRTENETSTTVTLSDGDSDNYYEISLPDDSATLPSEIDTITYEIYMSSNTQNVTVNAFTFTLGSLPTGLSYKEGWFGPDDTHHTDITAPPATGQSNTSVYSFNPTNAENNPNDIVPGYSSAEEENDQVKKVGEITFTVDANLAKNTEIQPKLSNVEVKSRAAGDMYAIGDVTTQNVKGKGIKADPQYTITLQYKKNADHTNLIENGTTATLGQKYSFSTGLAANILPAPGPVNAYRYGETNDTPTDGAYPVKWKVVAGEENKSANWDANTVYTRTTGIPVDTSAQVGNVTLEAVYSPIVYTATVVLDENGSTEGFHPTFKYRSGETVTYKNASPDNCAAYAITGARGYTHEYTIDNVSALTYLGLDNTDGVKPTRNGYNFVKWTAAKTDTADTDFYDAWLTAKVDENEGTPQNKDDVTDVDGLYGNVTFTAVWSVFGYRAATSYAYTSEDNALVLFAVPYANIIPGKYQISYTSGANEYTEDMFKVTTSKYSSVFKADTDTQTDGTQAIYKDIDDAETEQEPAIDSLFAYILPATDAGTNAANLTFKVVENAAEDAENKNVNILYNGNVWDTNEDHLKVNAADYGDVNTLLGDSEAFNNEERFDVRSALEADMVTPESDEANFGSISDIAEIIAQLGITIADDTRTH